MKHPHSFAFYFLYSHSAASPAAGCSSRAHRAWATRCGCDRAPWALGPHAEMPHLGSSLLAQCLAAPHMSPMCPHSLKKLQGQPRAGSSQGLCSANARQEGSLVFQVTQWQIIGYYRAAQCQQWVHRILSQMRIQQARSSKAAWPESEMQNLMMDCSPSNEMNNASSINEMQVHNLWHRALEVLNWERETFPQPWRATNKTGIYSKQLLVQKLLDGISTWRAMIGVTYQVSTDRKTASLPLLQLLGHGLAPLLFW